MYLDSTWKEKGVRSDFGSLYDVEVSVAAPFISDYGNTTLVRSLHKSTHDHLRRVDVLFLSFSTFASLFSLRL